MRQVPLVALLAAALLGAAAGTASAQITGTEVKQVRFEGNQAFEDDLLRRLILTRGAECRNVILAPFCALDADFALEPYLLSPIALPQDVARLRLYYAARGFRYAQVDTALAYRSDSSAVDVTFQIQENEPVRVEDLRFSGFEAFGPDILSGLTTRVGTPLDQVALDADTDTLQFRLQNRGYAHAEVLRSSFIPRADSLRAEVTLSVFAGTPARIGAIGIEGQSRLDESVIRRMLPFSEGSIYRRDDILAAQRNLYSLELVRSATVAADLEHSPDTIVPVQIRITEGEPRRTNAGGGISTADCLNAEVRWTNRNAGGGGRRLQLRTSASNILAEELQPTLCPEAGTEEYGVLNWAVGVDFSQPWFFGVRNALTASVFFEQQTLNDVFVRRAVGSSLAITRNLLRGASFAVSYRPQFARLSASDLFFCTSFLVCDPTDIEQIERFNWLSPFALSLGRTRTDQLFNPTRGSSLLLDYELARQWTGSAFSYDRLIGEAAWYRALGRDVILATRMRAGWVKGREFTGSGVRQSGIIHPQKRLFGGGANSVRGYAQSQLGPRVVTVGVGNLIAPDGTIAAPCSPSAVMDLTCDAQTLPDRIFSPRPTGGAALLVGNAELRLRLTGNTLQGVLFADVGQVWNEVSDWVVGDLEVTPGFGFRYFSPIGPIRLDLGYRLAGGERLRVVTEQIRAFDPETDDPTLRVLAPGDAGEPLPWVKTGELAVLASPLLFDDEPDWAISRFQLHIAIGQAF